jgi:hypothetical protein
VRLNGVRHQVAPGGGRLYLPTGGTPPFGGLWYIEAVPDRGELVVIEQAELTAVGRLHRYSWEHLEDEYGGLTDQVIDPEADPLEAIRAEEFQRVWHR